MKVLRHTAFIPPGWLFLLGMIVIVAGANFLVVRGQTFLGVLLFDPALMAVTRENFQRTNSWNLPVSFAVPTLILFFYFWKIARGLDAIRRGEKPAEIARRRLINLPAFSALISMTGWLIGSSSVITYVLFSSGPTYPGFISGNLFLAVLNALLCFVFIYYAVEYLNQVLFVPLFFPEGRISEVPGTLFFRVRTRFYIFFLAISLYPVATLVAYLLRLRQEGIRAEETGMGILFSLIALAIAAALTYMISRSYHRPLAEMKTAVEKIRRGDYSTQVQVLSNDEAGLLGEALNEMSADLRDKEMMKEAFGKMVDPAVRDHILSGEVKLGGEIREATILFTDIRNFTGLSEHRDPEEIVEWLNRFFTEVGQAVAAERGFINKFIGDAVMAVFGAPLAISDHADRALRAALGIRRGVAELNEAFRKKKPAAPPDRHRDPHRPRPRRQYRLILPNGVHGNRRRRQPRLARRRPLPELRRRPYPHGRDRPPTFFGL